MVRLINQMKQGLNNKIWDVAVIGGGPSGMMAAGRAAELGASVILIEKNEGLGEKLLITGGGRCNLTNNELDVRKFLKKYKENDKFLFSAFSQFSVKDTLKFFNDRGMDTKVEAEGRVFPKSDSAKSVWNVLVEYLKKNKVVVKSNSPVLQFITEKDNRISGVKVKGGEIIKAKAFILATGGISRPETGSTGDGFHWLASLGHKVMPTNMALVPISIKDKWIKKIQGISLTNIKLTTFQNNQKQESVKGKILFTHFGVSGPTVLNMSKEIGELLKYGEVIIKLDLLPELDYSMLNNKLQELFKTDSNKKLKNSLDKIIPSSMVKMVLELTGIDGEIKNNSVKREDRIRLIDFLKGIPMEVGGLLGEDKAVVSSGGVALEEVDFKTMKSKKIDNLYMVGDVLNIDRPSGGYSLQLCWTTGFVSGSSAALNLNKNE